MNALLQHRGHLLMGAGHSIAVQNFNENLSILVLLGVYALMIKARARGQRDRRHLRPLRRAHHGLAHAQARARPGRRAQALTGCYLGSGADRIGGAISGGDGLEGGGVTTGGSGSGHGLTGRSGGRYPQVG